MLLAKQNSSSFCDARLRNSPHSHRRSPEILRGCCLRFAMPGVPLDSSIQEARNLIPPPADLHLLCSRAPVRHGLQNVSFNSLQGVCMTMLGTWEIVGCYKDLATCRGRNRLDTLGNHSRSLLPKTAMQDESADNLREAMNSPSSFRTCTETGHSLFFNFVLASGRHALGMVARRRSCPAAWMPSGGRLEMRDPRTYIPPCCGHS